MKICFYFVFLLGLTACSSINKASESATPLFTPSATHTQETTVSIFRPTRTPSQTQMLVPTIAASLTEGITESPSPTENPPLNPQGPYLAYLAIDYLDTEGYQIRSHIVVLNSDGSGRKDLSAIESYGYVLGPFSPDGKYCIFLSENDLSSYPNDMTLRLINIPSGEVTPVSAMVTEQALSRLEDCQDCLPDGRVLTNQVHWSSDGRFLAFAASPKGNALNLFSYDTREGILRQLTNSDADVVSIDWSPDGKTIAFVNGVGWQDGWYTTYTINLTQPENGTNLGIQSLQILPGSGLVPYGYGPQVWLGGSWAGNKYYRIQKYCKPYSYGSKNCTETSIINVKSGNARAVYQVDGEYHEVVDPVDKSILFYGREWGSDIPYQYYSLFSFTGEKIATI